MPSKPKPSQTATGKVIVPKKESASKSRIITPQQFKKNELKRHKKPSKGGTGYRNYGSA